MEVLTRIARLLHYVHPEITHRLGFFLFSLPLPSCSKGKIWRVGQIETYGPVGIAAGLDKTGLYARFLSFFCPGFIVVGSTLPYRRRGNRPPRAARVHPYSLVNAMGLNSPGVGVVLSRIAKINYPIFVSIAGFSESDFIIQLRYLELYKPAAIEVNVSSPTYKGLWRLAPELFDVDIPIFLKIGPTVDIRNAVEQARKRGWGLVVTNTFPVEDRRISVGRGGLSGLLIYRQGLRVLQYVRKYAGGDVPIIYSGGVFTCKQLNEVLKFANAVEVLTAILYFGPLIVKYLNECNTPGR